MKTLAKRLLAAGLFTSMVLTPAGAFAATTDTVPEAPEGAELEVITDGQAAKAGTTGAWALINLIAAAITVIIAGIAAILGLKKKEENEDEEKEADKTNRKLFVRALGVIVAIEAVIAFILTEDMSLPMQLTDKWTLMMIIMLAIEAVLGIASKKTREEGEEKQAEATMAEAKIA